jgi:DnaJ domain
MQATTGSKSFIEVLEAEIRADLRKEIEAEVLARFGQASQPTHQGSKTSPAGSQAVHAAGRLETWLATNMGRTTFARPQAFRSYGSAPKAASGSTAHATSKAQAQTAEHAGFAQKASPASADVTRRTAATPEELCALELFNRISGSKLGTSFTEDEIKTAWRKAALKTHPDRFASEDQITQARMSAIFRELCEAYELLSNTSNTAQAA